ncbi:hypothetical protein [Streptomyces violaceusniger]|uniref:Uncharacterized protein n=1 Tax=Streptomyces violaceusniger TaxID=68280 RepID=A0A4D4L280_STRVO|nr:hypothetical protein SVIO_027820 [Streptomyces violaceusniger]
MARSGELTRRRWNGVGEQPETDELRRLRRESLCAGRRTRARDADARTAK